jgi:alpha-N-arabinofuranosidase
MILLASQGLSTTNSAIQFRVEARADKHAFYYSLNNRTWILIKDNVDGKFLSTKVAGGFGANFVGNTIGLYATSLGTMSGNKAYYDWFEYKGDDEVYR